MVKEKKGDILFLTIPLLVVVYSGSLLPSGMVFPIVLVLITLLSLITALARFSSGLAIRRLWLICFAVLCGCVALESVSRNNRHIRTLAPRARITAVIGELKNDPVPAGPDFYRSTVIMRSVETCGINRFSATGLAVVCFPAALIQQALPGGITLSYPEKDFEERPVKAKCRAVIAKGAVLTLPVVYHPGRSGERDQFIVTAEPYPVYGDQWASKPGRIRAQLRLSLIRMLYDWKESGGLLLALLSGNRDYIRPGLAVAFRDAGLSHILALSGMHLSIIGGIALGLGMGTGGKKFSIRFTLLVLFLFVWFAGNSPSLDRALIMAVIAAILRTAGIRTGLLSLLAVSCLVQTLITPEQVISPAFMLSYTALLGIILAGEWISGIGEPWIPRRVLSAPAASIGAQLFTVPVVAILFGVLSPAGIIAACAVSPLITLFLASGLVLVTAASIFPEVARVFLPFYNWLYRIISSLVQWFASFPRIVLEDLSAMLAAGILCLAGIFLLYFLYDRTRTRRAPDVLFTGL